MRTILICPDRTDALAALATSGPLVCAPLLGASPLEFWLEHLALQGSTQVHLLVSDRPEAVGAIAGEGTRWGLRVEVDALGEEFTPAKATARYGPDSDVRRLDHLPGLPDFPLFTSYAAWFAALIAWLPRARTPARIGMHEIAPDVWAGLHTHVAADVTFHGPVWIGAHARIGAGAVIGPNAVIEDRAWIDPGAVVGHSVVGPNTFVGGLCELNDSLAAGATLVNWRDGSRVEVTDPFLLCSLGPPPAPETARRPWKWKLPWISPASRPALGTIPAIDRPPSIRLP